MNFLIGLIIFFSVGLAVFFILYYLRTLDNLKNSFKQLVGSFNELDEQAKLIVKTDLELNKAQEELDKRLNGLDALQKISRQISTTLEEGELFNRLDQPFLAELGFDRYLVFMFDKNDEPQCLLRFRFSVEESNEILLLLTGKQTFIKMLKEKQLLSSSVNTSEEIRSTLTQILRAKNFVMAPILAQSNFLGFIAATKEAEAFVVTEGDEELVSILADQIGQAIENARLFEQVYRSTQSLELKVQERTKQLSTALEEVKKISKTKSDFISAVSHELRTPLTSIKGYASLLISGKAGEVSEKVKDRLEKINKHSDNLVNLINNLLDISRIESGKTEMKFIKHDLRPIVNNVKDLLTPQLKEKDIHFVADIEDELPEVLMDSSQIERVFINLVGNAIKFTPENGTITIHTVQEGSDVNISISDTGIGIKDEDIPRLFDEFYRVENLVNQNVKGTGLGLALVKNIIEAHRGKIWATSKLHKGSTFHFTLPVEPKETLSEDERPE